MKEKFLCQSIAIYSERTLQIKERSRYALFFVLSKSEVTWYYYYLLLLLSLYLQLTEKKRNVILENRIK